MSFTDQGHITHLKRIAGAVTTPAPFRALPHIETGAAWLFIGVLVFQIVILARHAFELRYGDDAAMLYYMAFLINEHDYLPYRDIHETSFPGTFLLYGLITKITGYSVLAFNVTHMLVLGLFGAASVLLLKKINLRMAIAATCAFGSSYFFMNKAMFMQRDFFVLILTLYAMLAMTSEWRLATRSIITGLLLALASSIKPHVILAAPIVVLSGATLHHAGFSLRTMFQAAWIALASFFAFWAVLIAVMVITGCWDAFYDMATEYLPLYQRMNGIHVTQSLDVRLKNLVNPCITLIACGLLSMAVWRQKITPLIAAIAATFLTLGYITEKRANPQQDFLFLLEWIPVVYGIVLVCFMAHCTEKKRKLIIALLFVAADILLYVAIAGKNWDYHQMPALYFYACLLCLAFIPFYIETWKTFGFRLLYLAIMVFALRGYVGPDYALVDACMTKDPGCGQPEKLQDAQEDRLETFLRNHVKPEQRVEVIAPSPSGILMPAMLRANIQPATAFIESFCLYHDADAPYVQQKRQEKLQQMQRSPPRFALRPDVFFVPGGTAASPFDELENFISQHYERVDKNRYPELGDGLPVIVYELQKL